MLDYLIYSYYIVAPLICIFTIIYLFLGNTLTADDTSLNVFIILVSPITLILIIAILTLLFSAYIFKPAIQLLLNINLKLPEKYIYKLNTKEQIKAELILANYTKKYLKNGTTIYTKDDVYINIGFLNINISYKTGSETM